MPAEDYLPERGRGPAPRKRRLRSDSNSDPDSVTPSRRKIPKSPVLCDADNSPDSHLKENLPRLPVREGLFDNAVERPVWNPAGK